MKRPALAIAMAIMTWAQAPMPPMPGAPEYPQGDPRSPQGNQGLQSPDVPSADEQPDAPDRGVARISYMAGNVSVRRGDSGELVAAIVNAPLTIGDRVVTGEGRAEVQFDSANMIRLGPSTEVRFSELQYHRYQIQIAAGSASFRVLRDSDAQVEISTPSISVRPVRRGVYRINIRPDGTTEITLRAGADGEVFGPRGSEAIHNNNTMLVRGGSNDPEFQMTAPPPEDDFDRWAASRDRQLESATAPRYVPRDVYGAEDLDNNGVWRNDPQYGQVWQPTGVDPNWAPYRCGRWVWIDYYGWSWVGCEPWGWAPYHYGNWFYGAYGWAWWPGPLYARYYWRPALVGFFGWGAGVGVGFGFGFGNVGWVPLAPFEVFHPWYGPRFYGGYRGVTVVNNINVTNVYRNARVMNGVTSMRAGEFGRAAVSNTNFVRASAADLRSAGAMRGQMPFQPSRESTQFTNRAPMTQGMPRTSENARFFSRSAPAQTNRVPFEQQRQSFSSRPAGGMSGAPSLGSGGSSAGNAGGWRGAESPAARGNMGPPAGTNNGGWQRFNPNANGGQGSRPPMSSAPAPRSMPNSGGGGWQRMEGNRGTGPTSGPAPNESLNRGGMRGNAGGGPGYQSSPQSRGVTQPGYNRNYSQQPQQLRISPPIVQNRGQSSHGGGAPRPGGGGGAPHSGGGNRGGNNGGRH